VAGSNFFLDRLNQLSSRKKAVVVTSIAPPNQCLAALAEGAQEHDFDFLYIADVKTPANFQLEGCEFVSMDVQKELPFKYIAAAPTHHYARKNIGYLLAASRGAEVIIETDDDNFPSREFWETDLDNPDERGVTAIGGQGWFNVYEHFGTNAWPRGFPLEVLKNGRGQFSRSPWLGTNTLVRQGLVAGDPDVDAIYRLTHREDVHFEARPPVWLGKGVWCPINSQNTTWLRVAFPLMYLPSSCSSRATDIVRGYVALRCLWELGSGVIFAAPSVNQERNPHDLMRDFHEEWIIYTKASEVARILGGLELDSGVDAVGMNLRRCYGALITVGIVAEHELTGVDAWLTDTKELRL
jgi:hypothetical protein